MTDGLAGNWDGVRNCCVFFLVYRNCRYNQITSWLMLELPISEVRMILILEMSVCEKNDTSVDPFTRFLHEIWKFVH